MADLYLVLLHHPVLDKNGQVVTTALTNLDIHDIARSARTYGVRRFYVAHPVKALRVLAAKIMEHWDTGYGSTYNATRKDALSRVVLEQDLDTTILALERETGQRPRLIMTSARAAPGRMSFAQLREEMQRRDDPHLVVLGTGWGLTEEITNRADAFLEPIQGSSDYNHLSVRAAAAILLDRLQAPR